jgi:hypothetical protein
VILRGHPYAEFMRALDRGNVWVAEAVARELPKLSLARVVGSLNSPSTDRYRSCMGETRLGARGALSSSASGQDVPDSEGATTMTAAATATTATVEAATITRLLYLSRQRVKRQATEALYT